MVPVVSSGGALDLPWGAAAWNQECFLWGNNEQTVWFLFLFVVGIKPWLVVHGKRPSSAKSQEQDTSFDSTPVHPKRRESSKGYALNCVPFNLSSPLLHPITLLYFSFIQCHLPTSLALRKYLLNPPPKIIKRQNFFVVNQERVELMALIIFSWFAKEIHCAGENMYGLRENPHKNAAEKAEKETRDNIYRRRSFSLSSLRFLPVM